ncbi:MAG: carboxypeptidase-like regulatory domain-containing protein [Bacillota bacterium]
MRLKSLTPFITMVLVLCMLVASLPALAEQAVVVEIYKGTLPFTGSIQGQVTGETTSGSAYPVAGTLVTAWRVEKPGVPPAWGVWGKEDLPPGIAKRIVTGNPFAWTTADDKSGNYRFADLPGGTYVLIVRAPWYLPAKAVVQVVPGSTVTQNVYLRGVYGAVGGVVYDVYNNAPLERATVVLFASSDLKPELKGKHLKWKGFTLDLTKDLEAEDLDARLQPCGAKIARTDETGCYCLNAPPGTYRLLTIRPGYEPAMQTVNVTAQKLTRYDVGLKKAAPPPVPVTKMKAQNNWKFNQKYIHKHKHQHRHPR